MKYVYPSRLLLASLLLFASLFTFAQNNPWQDVSETRISATVPTGTRRIVPSTYRSLQLDTAALLQALKSAPKEFTPAARTAPLVVLLPMPDGTIARFAVVETAELAPELAAKFPNIKTYGGQGLDDRYATLKMQWTEAGLTIMVLSPVSGTIFIDPFAPGQKTFYQSYYKINVQPKKGLQGEDVEKLLQNTTGAVGFRTLGTCIGGTLRTYRLAVACTGEYARALGFGNGVTPAQALNAITVSVARVNGIYERELDIRLQLVATNNKIVFTDPATDRFAGNNDANVLINESQTVITDSIGTANFDIGHTFSTGGGGLAGLGVVCSAGAKARGITGSPSPFGDPYDVDYVAHEVGHQFGGNHTFNANTGFCGGNGSSVANAEPGSGSTIMAYAGICGSNDLQPNSDAQFHAISFNEITTFSQTGSGNNCAVTSATGNTPPTANAGADYAIPRSTPFILTGTGADANGDALTYSWEQIDVGGPFGNWNAPSGNAPLFRSFAPVTTGVRFFPRLSDVLNNTQTIGELLPSYARTANFKLTVRDNRAGGGGICSDEMVLTVAAAAGPFLVTAPNTATTWTVGEFRTITWDVAGTTAAPVSCANVLLELSTDGGLTFPTTIVASTANDGSEEIIVPNNVTTQARVRVRAVGNVFYDLSNTNFTIQAAATPGIALNNPPAVTVCSGNSGTLTLRTNGTGGFSGSISFAASGAPGGTSVIFGTNPVTAGGSTTVTLQSGGALPAGTYNITITGTSGSVSSSRVVTFAVGVTNPTTLSSPANGATGQPQQPTFTWAAAPGATAYALDIATNSTFTADLQTFSGITTTTYTIPTPLAQNTTYYWRVAVDNACGRSAYSASFVFRTALNTCTDANSTDVPKTIPITAATVTSNLVVATSGLLTDVDVINLVGTHSYISDLRLRLTSPAGTTVTLFSQICSTQDNFDINFDDEAASATIPCPPIGGITRRPQQALSAFDGQQQLGTWVLTIDDLFDADGGSLTSWGLRLCVPTATPLPVNWLSFTAEKSGAFRTGLQWQTANEERLSHYEIERSADGIQFETIGRATAGRGSNNLYTYLYTDGAARKGANYYRIRSVDVDGRATLSRIAVVMFEETGATVLVYPNPAKDKATLRVLDATEKLQVRVLDATGRLVWMKNNGATAAGAELTLPVGVWGDGMYTVQVSTNQGMQNHKLLVR